MNIKACVTFCILSLKAELSSGEKHHDNDGFLPSGEQKLWHFDIFALHKVKIHHCNEYRDWKSTFKIFYFTFCILFYSISFFHLCIFFLTDFLFNWWWLQTFSYDILMHSINFNILPFQPSQICQKEAKPLMKACLQCFWQGTYGQLNSPMGFMNFNNSGRYFSYGILFCSLKKKIQRYTSIHCYMGSVMWTRSI